MSTSGTAHSGEIWSEVRGEGPDALLYIHGLNAHGGVFEPLDELASSWPGRRILIDLPGHGRSAPARRYTYGQMADAVAAVAGDAYSLTIVGHSMGGVIALALASGWFGVNVSNVVAFGIKANWTADELERARAVSEKPARQFDTYEEAATRFLRLAGLDGLVDPASELVQVGVQGTSEGAFEVVADPKVSAIGAPSLKSLTAAAQAPVRLACGENDPLVGVDELRPYDPEAEMWDGVGHNAQVESPAQVWETLQRITTRG